MDREMHREHKGRTFRGRGVLGRALPIFSILWVTAKKGKRIKNLAGAIDFRGFS